MEKKSQAAINVSALDDMGRISATEIVAIAEYQGKAFTDAGIKTHQIRNIYSEITAMKLLAEQSQAETGSPDTRRLLKRLILLKPKLAYAAGKQRAVRGMYTFMRKAIDGVEGASDLPQAFENFFDLIESVVAYHKFYGDH